jgi:hypothetical protein
MYPASSIGQGEPSNIVPRLSSGVHVVGGRFGSTLHQGFIAIRGRAARPLLEWNMRSEQTNLGSTCGAATFHWTWIDDV